jgi:predicted Zn-dependent peptidase
MKSEAQSPVRSRLPEPGPARRFSFPPIEKSTLASGLRIWTVAHTAIPVVTVMLLLRRGSADDPPGLDGLAALTVDMLDEAAAAARRSISTRRSRASARSSIPTSAPTPRCSPSRP